MNALGIIYDNNIFVRLDVSGDDNCFYISIVKSDFITCSDSRILRSDLTINSKYLFMVSESPKGCQLRNYHENNEFNSGGIIDDYIDRLISLFCEAE